MSSLSHKTPLASNPSYSKLNQTLSSADTEKPETSSTQSQAAWRPEKDSESTSTQQPSALNGIAAGDLPVKRTFSTSLTNPKGATQISAQLAQAALALEFKESGGPVIGGDISTNQCETDSLAIDPQLLALDYSDPNLRNPGVSQLQQGSGLSTIGPILIHDDNLDAEGSVHNQEDTIFQPSILQTTKRKDFSTGTSPVKEPQAKRFRTTSDIAAELQAPLPPPRTILGTHRQVQAISTPAGTELRQRVSLSGLRSNGQDGINNDGSQSDVGENASAGANEYLKYIQSLKEQIQYLEIRLYNRNFESNRQAEEIRRANDYASQAKACMRRDGVDINRLRRVTMSAKSKVEVWRSMLEPVAILDSPQKGVPDDGNETEEDPDMCTSDNLKPAAFIVQDAKEVIKNFEKALVEISDRPVHEIDRLVHLGPTFDHRL